MFLVLNRSIVRFVRRVETSKPCNRRRVVGKTVLVVCAPSTTEAKTRALSGKGLVRYVEKRAVMIDKWIFYFFGKTNCFVRYILHEARNAVRSSDVTCFDRSRYLTDGKKNSVFGCSEPRGRSLFTRRENEKRMRRLPRPPQ